MLVEISQFCGMFSNGVLKPFQVQSSYLIWKESSSPGNRVTWMEIYEGRCMLGADASFPLIRLIPLWLKADPSVAFHLKWQDFCKKNTACARIKLNLVLTLQNITLKSRMQAAEGSVSRVRYRQWRYWSFIFPFHVSSGWPSQLSVLPCEWKGDVTSQENERRRDAAVWPPVPGSDHFTCRAVTLAEIHRSSFRAGPCCYCVILTCLIFTSVLFLSSWLIATKRGLSLPWDSLFPSLPLSFLSE